MIPKQISATDVGAPLISIMSRSTLSSDTKDPPKISNGRHICYNYLQPTLRLHEIFPTDARSFETGNVAPLGMSEILTPGLPLTRS